MTVAKFKVVIRREKLSKSTNEAPVCLRITKDRKVTYKTLLHVSPDYWDEKEQCVKKQHPNAVALNAVISKRKAELEKETCFLSLRDDSVSIETIRNKINDRTSFDLFEYAEKYIENLRKNQKHATPAVPGGGRVCGGKRPEQPAPRRDRHRLPWPDGAVPFRPVEKIM